MTWTKNDSPNEMFAACEEEIGRATVHASSGVKSIRLAKNNLYRAAKAYLALIKYHHNWFVDQVRSTEGQGSGAVDRWVQTHFGWAASIGEDYAGLIKAVEGGMTLKSYLRQTPGMFLNRQRRQCAIKEIATPIPSEPSVELPAEEQIKQMRVLLAVYETKYQAAQTEIRQLRSECARLKQAFARIQKLAGMPAV